MSVSCIQVNKENIDALKVQILINMYKPSPHLLLTCSSVSLSHPPLPVKGVRKNESRCRKWMSLHTWSTASLNSYVCVYVKLRVRSRLRPNSRSSRLSEAFLLHCHTLPFRRESGRCGGGFTFTAFVSVFPGCVSSCIDKYCIAEHPVYFPPSIFSSVLRAQCTLQWM